MKHINVILAILLMLCCLTMPYGYYQLIRFVSMMVFIIMAFKYYAKTQMALAITFGALALLFQPFLKIPLGRVIWNVVDYVVALFLLVLYFLEKIDEERDMKKF